MTGKLSVKALTHKRVHNASNRVRYVAEEAGKHGQVSGDYMHSVKHLGIDLVGLVISHKRKDCGMASQKKGPVTVYIWLVNSTPRLPTAASAPAAACVAESTASQP